MRDSRSRGSFERSWIERDVRETANWKLKVVWENVDRETFFIEHSSSLHARRLSNARVFNCSLFDLNISFSAPHLTNHQRRHGGCNWNERRLSWSGQHRLLLTFTSRLSGAAPSRRTSTSWSTSENVTSYQFTSPSQQYEQIFQIFVILIIQSTLMAT